MSDHYLLGYHGKRGSLDDMTNKSTINGADICHYSHKWSFPQVNQYVIRFYHLITYAVPNREASQNLTFVFFLENEGQSLSRS